MVFDIYPFLNQTKRSKVNMTLTNKDVMETLKGKKEAVQRSIDAIKDFKKQQKELYRMYYTTKDDMDQELEKYKTDPQFELYQGFCDIDVSDIFYEKRKRT